MGAVPQGFPQRVRREGRLLQFVTHAPHADDGEQAIVLCKDDAGALFYLPQEEWLADAHQASTGSQDDKRQLPLQGDASIPNDMRPNTGIVTSASSTADKVALFKSLFQARSDVYAHGYRRKDGGIGYAPACANEYARGICPKCLGARVECGRCDRRAFRKLTDRVLVAHFKGEDERLRDVVGIYVLLPPDDTTSVLVADFDGVGWRESASAYRDAARAHGLDPATERSRSGNGAHVWLFFAEPVSARDARRLGTRLLAEAMSRTQTVGFSSFDRLFPSQDIMPKGGFGNLIALPLQGRAVAKGNSVFVDDEFQAYADQWAYLSCVTKVGKQGVENLIRRAHGSAQASLRSLTRSCREQSAETESDNAVEGNRPVSCGDAALDAWDFPRHLSIVLSDMLYVPEAGLSPAALSRIRWIAAYANPEFYRAQAQGRSVYNISRYIYVGETRDLSDAFAGAGSAHEGVPAELVDGSERAVALPRGCRDELVELLKASGVDFDIRDMRTSGKPVELEFVGELRPDQQEAAEALVKYDGGILSAPTGFGKTVIGAWLIAREKVSTLVVVPKTALLSQWRKSLSGFLLGPDGKFEVGVLGGGKARLTGVVDVATFQSLTKTDTHGVRYLLPEARSYGMVIVDECHHAAAPQLEFVLKRVSAHRIFGLSATPRRSDGLDRTLSMVCGPIRYAVDPKEQARRQGFARLLVTRFTGVRYPGYEVGMTHNQVLDLLCESEARNALIVDDVVRAVRSGAAALVMSKRRKHVSDLTRRLKEAGLQPYQITGDGTQRSRQRIVAEAHHAMEKFYNPGATSDVSSGCDARNVSAVLPVIVATESCLGEGFDMPELTALFMATPVSYSGVVIQQVGRLHRVMPGKSAVTVYDYVDISIPQLERSYKRRLKVYASLGYEVAGGSEASDGPRGSFVDAATWAESFTRDVQATLRSIEVFAPCVDMECARMLAPVLEQAVSRGIRISCYIGRRAPRGRSHVCEDAQPVRTFEQAGCKVVPARVIRSGLAVFDEKITWYGDLPLLGRPSSEASSIRIDSAEVAHDLYQEVCRISGLDRLV
ncbi:DEAD/DEAH box helicase family protein [Collinsella sp. An2]|uniref:TOTE conflict system archaeo-eukaryotic primase domain-containing protein n=1 Tax=Collinsella sp. An2 TaxID=1965585 RepID=UPI000B38EC11|nr:DEAD/DEAH box helicase family protein [Collinsella sp. An2]OUP07100.1 hypothetical protein B5F33_09460 [Collinsella sp. An2]